MGGTPRGGAQTRFVSEPETIWISSAVLLLDSNKSLEKQSRTPTLNHNMDLELTRSSPNIFPPPGSEPIETPLGVGLGTRLQVHNNLHLIEQKNRVERNQSKPAGWASDISKMYNQLRLNKSASPDSIVLLLLL